MARITSIQWYYQIVLLLFLFLTIFTLMFVSTYSEDECFAPLDDSENATVTEDDVEPADNLTVMPAVLVFGYIALVGLTFLMSLSIYYFSNLDIDRFGSLNCCQRILAMFTKCIPYLINLGHLFVFIMLLAQVFLVYVVQDCVDAIHTDPQTNEETEGAMQEEAELHIIVCSSMWIAMQYCGGFFRRNVYSDAFFYQPEVAEEKWKNWLCIRIGP